MAGRIFMDDGNRALDNNGDPISGAKLRAYEAGTSTLASLYTSPSLSAAHADPLVADGSGYFAQMWAAYGTLLDVKLYPASDTTYTTPLREFLSVSPVGSTEPEHDLFVAGLFTDLPNVAVPSGVELIRTTGFSSAGRGRALYRRLASAPTADEVDDQDGFSIRQDASGAWWRLDEPVLESDMFGTTGDATHDAVANIFGGTDATEALQKMVHCARHWSGKGYCRVSPGKHRVAGWVHLTYGVHPIYEGLTIEGYGINYMGQYVGGSTIYSSSYDKPPFVVQGARNVFIRHLTFVGPLGSYIQTENLGTPYAVNPTIDHTNIANWVKPDGPKSFNGVNYRYAALGAIVIDPFAGTRPAPSSPPEPYPVSYPDVDYPQYLNNPGQYNKMLSAFVTIEQCFFTGYVAALIISPSDNDNQNDSIVLRDNQIVHCLYCLSVGPAQARNIDFSGNTFWRVHTGITNIAHGNQTGRLHGKFVNNQVWNSAIQLLDCSASWAGPVLIEDFRSEALWRIGNWGSGVGGNANPLTFQGGHFDFAHYDVNRPTSGEPATILSKSAKASVTFEGCSFGSFGEVMVFEGYPDQFSFRNCRTNDSGSPGGFLFSYSREDQYVASNFLCSVMFVPNISGGNRPAEFSIVAARSNIDFDPQTSPSPFELGGGVRQTGSTTERSYNGCAWSRRFAPSNYRDNDVEVQYDFWTASWVSASNASQFNSGVLSGDILTITPPTSMTGSLADRLRFGIYPGSILFFQIGSYVFQIEKVEQTTPWVITARLLNGLAGAGGSATIVGDGHARGVPPVGLSLTEGRIFVGTAAVYTPSDPTFGDFGTVPTNRVAVVNVGHADGDGAFIATEFKVDDLLLFDNNVDATVPASFARIVTVSAGSPGYFILAGPADKAVTDKRIPLVVRGDIPNKT